MNALIGYSGFVGTTLLKQTTFAHLYRSTNITEIRGKTFDTVVCAGASAQKWLANQDPENDLVNINNLITELKSFSCKKFILISTVDVFKDPINVAEDTAITTEGLHAYGANRYLLERFVAEHFDDYLIVRLPGLVGPGLKKNIIFDFLNNNNLDAIDSRGVFQFYPMVNLWFDITKALSAGLRVVHLTAEAVSVAEVAREGFGKDFDNQLQHPAAVYDMKTRHAALFGGAGEYQYSKRDTLQAIRFYAQSEVSDKK